MIHDRTAHEARQRRAQLAEQQKAWRTEIELLEKQRAEALDLIETVDAHERPTLIGQTNRTIRDIEQQVAELRGKIAQAEREREAFGWEMQEAMKREKLRQTLDTAEEAYHAVARKLEEAAPLFDDFLAKLRQAQIELQHPLRDAERVCKVPAWMNSSICRRRGVGTFVNNLRAAIDHVKANPPPPPASPADANSGGQEAKSGFLRSVLRRA
jgi:hypothetical protein